MLHMTVNTGHTRESPRHEVSDDVIETMRMWLAPGDHELPVPGGYRLVVPVCTRGGWLGTVYQADAPIATIGVADTERSAESIWGALCEIQRVIAAPVAMMPDELPWVGAVLLLPSPAMEWLGDFERCLAWAYLEAKR